MITQGGLPHLIPYPCSLYLTCVLPVPHLCACCTSLVCLLYLTCVLAVPHLCARCTSLVCSLYLTCVLAVPHLCARCTSLVCSLYLTCVLAVPHLCARCTSLVCFYYFTTSRQRTPTVMPRVLFLQTQCQLHHRPAACVQEALVTIATT